MKILGYLGIVRKCCSFYFPVTLTEVFLPSNHLILRNQRSINIMRALIFFFLFPFFTAIIIPDNHVRILGSRICHSFSSFSGNFIGTSFKYSTIFHQCVLGKILNVCGYRTVCVFSTLIYILKTVFKFLVLRS